MAQELYRFQHPLAVARWEQFPQRSFFKLMNNSDLGKTQENLRNRVDVELITDARLLRKRVAKPSFYRGNPYSVNTDSYSESSYLCRMCGA